MADIAPLGFAVDTKVLADAASVAQDAAAKITGVADAADKVGEATAKNADKVKKSTDAHKEHAKAVTETAKAIDNLGQKTKEAGAAAATSAESELQARRRIHEMVERSLSQMDNVAQKQRAVLQLTGQLIPKNAGAQAFEKQIELNAAKKMGPTEADIARQAKAAKETERFRKELQSLTSAVDPAAAKLLRLDAIVESLGKKLDAGQISQSYYNSMLDKIDAQEARIKSGPANGYRRHNSFLGEVGRSFTYGIPRFGREARHLLYSAENEGVGGPLAGMVGFGRLAAGAGVGMLGVEMFRYIAQLPGKIAEANDETEKLQRRMSSFDIGGLRDAEGMADKLHISVKGAADAMIEFHNAMLRAGQDQQSQDKVFGAIFAAGRIGGLDEQGRAQSAAQFAGMANKATVSPADIAALQASNPALAKGIAGQLGTGLDGLTALAATGKLTGDRLFAATKAAADRLKSESDRLPINAKEWEQRAKDSGQKLDTLISDNIVGMFSRAGDKINRWLYGHLGGGEGSNSVTVPVPRDHTVTNALALVDKYDSATAGRRDKQKDLDDVNKALAMLSKINGGEDQAATLQRLRGMIGQSLKETPFGNLEQQVEDLTAALGHGGGNSGLIGVWQQALQVQREQEKQGLATAHSLQEIVNQLLAVKRAQQAIADGDELKRLQQSIAISSSNGRLAGQGSYAQQRAALELSLSFEAKQRAELYGGGMAGSVPVGGGAAGNLGSFLNAIRFVESRGRDYDAHGNPLRSSAGALFGMQVLPSTAARPGYGITAARSQTPEEYNRVGVELATALYHKYGGDISKAAAAYNAGPGHLGGGAGYAGLVLSRMGLGGATATSSGGGAPDFSKIRSARLEDFENTFAANSLGSIAGLAGDPYAFKNSGAVSGGAIGGTLNQIAAIRKGMTPVMREQLALEGKLNEEVKGIAPGYREAYKEARRLQDATEKRLQAEQESERIRQQANDNMRMAKALGTGEQNDVRALELQLKIEQARRTLPPDAAAQREKDLRADAAASSSMNFGRVAGGIRGQQQQLRDELQLQRYVGDELTVQERLMDAKRQIQSDMLEKSPTEVALAVAEAEALIRQNVALEKKLDLVNSIKGSYKFALDTIGAGWSKMFADMERTGKLHTKTLVRAIEDGFYGMLDRIYQKMVISPLMKVFDTLLNSLTNSLIGGHGLSTIPSATVGNATLPAISFGHATGSVFSPRGVVPFARGDFFNTPTRFAFGGGAQGIAGEGPGLYEAIMPLKRGTDGRLGVANHGANDNGGGQTIVNVIDQRGQGASPVEVQQRELGNGRRQVDILIRDAVRSNVGSGRLDTDMGASYGIRRPAVRR